MYVILYEFAAKDLRLEKELTLKRVLVAAFITNRQVFLAIPPCGKLTSRREKSCAKYPLKKSFLVCSVRMTESSCYDRVHAVASRLIMFECIKAKALRFSATELSC